MKNMRDLFPQYQYNPELCYLDSAASSLTPLSVLDAMNQYYIEYRANVHRGLYSESMKATDAYQRARENVARFIGASPEEIIFTRGATDGLNLIAELLAETVNEGDSIVTTLSEHHSNFLPWQQVCQNQSATLRVAEFQGQSISETSILDAIDHTTKIVAISQVSNVLGTIRELTAIQEKSQKVGAILVVDGCQAIAHMAVDVSTMGADFYVFSGHKMYGPTGIGVVYGKKEQLESLDPRRTGGGMVQEVSVNSYTPATIPERFEPGTPPIAEAIGLGAAVELLEKIGMDRVFEHQQELIQYTYQKIQERPWLSVVGECSRTTSRVGCFSFVIPQTHPSDVTQIVVSHTIAVRGGHHCAEPLSQALGIAGSTRLSYGIYTTKKDIDRAFGALDEAYQLLT